jgi:DNA-binding helix-hairpin-helix protein with protein kinase domain
VGVAHFTPPELQGQSFQGVIRTVNHDLFGLAILIFHLLCMGRHPYAGRFVGKGEPPPIEKAIEQYRYAYSSSNESLQIVPPPQTLLLPAVMPVLSNLFERAFGRGSDQEHARPTETEWHAALRDLKSQLKPCSADVGHKFPNYLGTCPWCMLEREGAPNFFASVTAHLVDRREGELTASLEALWRPLEELRHTAKSCVLDKVSFTSLQVTPTPIPEAVEQNHAFAQLIGRVVLMSLLLIALTWWNSALLAIFVTFAVGFGTWWIVLSRTYGLRTEQRRREERLSQAVAKLRSLEHEAAKQLDAARTQFIKTFETLELTRAEIEGLWPRYTADLDVLNLQRERRQLDAFLQSHSIREATIPLIGDWRKSTLASFGIETAYDISEIRVMNIDGFGPTYTSALLDWKRSIQNKFKFRPRQQLPNVDRNTILARYLRKREELEDVLASGRYSLELIWNQMLDQKSRYQQRLEATALDAKQAESDVMVVSW